MHSLPRKHPLVWFGLAIFVATSSTFLVMNAHVEPRVYAQASQEVQGNTENRAKNNDRDVQAKRGASKTRVARQEKVRLLCENHQKTVNNKLQAFGDTAQKNYDRLTVVFNKIVAVKEAHTLQVANYEELLIDTVAKQDRAKSAIVAVQGVASGIDCSQAGTEGELTGIKTTAASARNALKDYKTSLRALLQAVETTVDQAEKSQ